ncbi:MAG: protein phosphatase 2C domain-containing protein [Deltaproteobacteria bacterium]|nr:protein phosphatase 2C domain-containing protein [Deltaproteobacteria bacterium]
MKLEISASTRPTHDTSHDRLSVLRDAHRTLIALADGTDSSPGAQTAAARAVNELARCFRNGNLPEDPQDWVMVLEAIDHVVLGDPDAGETSALVLLVQQGVVVGASVGDSLAYIVSPAGDAQLLTGRQHRTPSIGTGLARPVGFGPAQLDGRLITRRAARLDPLFVAQTTLQSVHHDGWTRRVSSPTTNDPPIGT